MRTVNKAGSLFTHVVSDDNIQHYGMMLVSHGLKGAAKKINPVVLTIDVGLSVLGACNSYLEYAKACEVTKKIKLKNNLLKKQLEHQLKKMSMDLSLMEQTSEARCKALERAVIKHKAVSQQFQEGLQQTLEQVHVMHSLVKQERERGVSFEQLQHLQKQLDTFLRILVMHTLNGVDTI